MNGFFSHKGFKVLIIVICICLVLALITSGNSYVGNFMTGFIFTPLQQVTSGATRAAGDALTPSKTTAELEKEVSDLQQENRTLSNQLVDYYDLKKQNEELKKFYNIKVENTDFTLATATVIGRDPNENFYGFTIDKGSLDGVALDNPVMTENGLVGWVSEVSAASCKVTTILSPQAQIGATDKRTADTGIVSGDTVYSEQGLTRLTNITKQNSAEAGDIVVTSGFGGVYPKNIRIGKIESLTNDEYTGMPIAVIEPYEKDIPNLSSVAVITDFNGRGEIQPQESSVQSSH